MTAPSSSSGHWRWSLLSCSADRGCVIGSITEPTLMEAIRSSPTSDNRDLQAANTLVNGLRPPIGSVVLGSSDVAHSR